MQGEEARPVPYLSSPHYEAGKLLGESEELGKRVVLLRLAPQIPFSDYLHEPYTRLGYGPGG